MIPLPSRLRSGLMACFSLAFAVSLLFQSCGRATTQSNTATGTATGTDSFTERMATEHKDDRPIADQVISTLR